MAISFPNESTKYSAEAGEAITAGAAVAIHTDGKAYLANAQTGGSQQGPCKGFAETGVAAGETVCILTAGKLYNPSWSWTPNIWVYLGETDGALAASSPAHQYDYVQIVGFAVSATEILISLQPHSSHA